MADWKRDGCRYLRTAVPAAALSRLQSLAASPIGAGKRLALTDSLLAEALPWLMPIARDLIGDRAAAEQARAHPTLVCTAQAGDVWAYATPILHCSAKAAVPTRRRVLQVDFAAKRLPIGLAWAA